MTSVEAAALAVVALPALAAGALALVGSPRAARTVALGVAVVVAALSVALAVRALARPDDPVAGAWLALDAAGGVVLAVDGVVGLVAVLVSPAFLAGRSAAARRSYAMALFAFWSLLLAVPLAGNLAAAWLVVEATTAASALLVGFSGRRHALEAAWKYLVLTTLGLGVALFGIVVLEASGVPGEGAAGLAWGALHQAAPGLDPDVARVAFVLLLGGLAAKVGWAPVHNWLPDAHSEAPPPVSALLSGALLPSVLLVAWRVQDALAPAVGATMSERTLLVLGLGSLAVAVPFLWRPLPWKRLLAYSSLEHMGVIAVGIAFAHPLALAGVVIHIAGHAVAKTLGFVGAVPLLDDHPAAATHAATGVARTRPALAATLALSLAALAAVPPSPLFVSELLIVAGGYAGGHPWAATATLALLALGFLGLAHAAIELLAGRSWRSRAQEPRGLRGTLVLGVAAVPALLALAVAAIALPGSAIVEALGRGLT